MDILFKDVELVRYKGETWKPNKCPKKFWNVLYYEMEVKVKGQWYRILKTWISKQGCGITIKGGQSASKKD